MLRMIRRCPEFLSGYKSYCQELYDSGVLYFRSMDPAHVDLDWFYRTKPIYDRRETERVDGASRSLHLWAVCENRFIGEFQLRFDFTEAVLRDIGSVGYAVRPSEWGKGYGTQILRQGLAIAGEMGMHRVLFTVNSENSRSCHVIEKLGGKYEDTIEAYSEAFGNHLLRRYWIDL